jgi:hypothetical protein
MAFGLDAIGNFLKRKDDKKKTADLRKTLSARSLSPQAN